MDKYVIYKWRTQAYFSMLKAQHDQLDIYYLIVV